MYQIDKMKMILFFQHIVGALLFLQLSSKTIKLGSNVTQMK